MKDVEGRPLERSCYEKMKLDADGEGICTLEMKCSKEGRVFLQYILDAWSARLLSGVGLNDWHDALSMFESRSE